MEFQKFLAVDSLTPHIRLSNKPLFPCVVPKIINKIVGSLTFTLAESNSLRAPELLFSDGGRALCLLTNTVLRSPILNPAAWENKIVIRTIPPKRLPLGKMAKILGFVVMQLRRNPFSLFLEITQVSLFSPCHVRC